MWLYDVEIAYSDQEERVDITVGRLNRLCEKIRNRFMFWSFATLTALFTVAHPRPLPRLNFFSSLQSRTSTSPIGRGHSTRCECLVCVASESAWIEFLLIKVIFLFFGNKTSAQISKSAHHRFFNFVKSSMESMDSMDSQSLNNIFISLWTFITALFENIMSF